MNDRTNQVLDVLSGNRELQIGLDRDDMVRLFIVLFLAVLFANLCARLLMPNR